MIPALFKLRDILLHPPKNSRMAQSDASLRHHLDEVTEAQFKCDVPSHTQNDDLLVKVPSLEQILCRGRFRHPGSYRRIPSLSTVCTRTPAVHMYGFIEYGPHRTAHVTHVISPNLSRRVGQTLRVLGTRRVE